jgi:hypothetical protein
MMVAGRITSTAAAAAPKVCFFVLARVILILLWGLPRLTPCGTVELFNVAASPFVQL